MAQLQRLLQHEAGLGHGAFRRVHQQDDAVDHLEDAFHLAAEIGVARRVDDVDLRALVVHGGVFGKDGDAALALQIAGVHDAVDDRLIFAVDAALLEHLVDQRGLSVVNVSDDCNISDVFLIVHTVHSLLSGGLAANEYDRILIQL